jgi:ribose/xylose/arabinose/galactoside ABC-type transport system permease subunit
VAALGIKVFGGDFPTHNPIASRYAGLPVTKTLIYTYAISGFLVGIAGVLHRARNHQENPNDGASYEPDAIAAVVIGGTSMTGGKGTITATIIGAFIATRGCNTQEPAHRVAGALQGEFYHRIVGGV